MSSSTLERTFQASRVRVETSVTFDKILHGLRELTTGSSIPKILALAQEAANEEDYFRQVLEEFHGKNDFMLISEIDHGRWTARLGSHRHLTLWILGNPLIAITTVLEGTSTDLFAPIELLLTEIERGEGGALTYVLPSSLISCVADRSALHKAAEVLDAKFKMLVAAAMNARGSYDVCATIRND